MATCVTCGDELHLERAEKYDYCTKPECRAQNAEGLRMVAVGVNKASDHYLLLTERTEQEMASGRYKKRPELPARASRTRPPSGHRVAPSRPRSATSPRPRWSQAQENLALVYRSMGKKPEEIAKALGVSARLVIQMLLSASARGRR